MAAPNPNPPLPTINIIKRGTHSYLTGMTSHIMFRDMGLANLLTGGLQESVE